MKGRSMQQLRGGRELQVVSTMRKLPKVLRKV
jgi:hypothetical protein